MNMQKYLDELIAQNGQVKDWPLLYKAELVLNVYHNVKERKEGGVGCWIATLEEICRQLCEIPNSGLVLKHSESHEDSRGLDENNITEYSFGNTLFRFQEYVKYSCKGWEDTTWYFEIRQ